MRTAPDPTRTISRLWALLPTGGLLVGAAALHARGTTRHVHVLCQEPASLGVVFWAVVALFVVVGLGSAVGVVHLLADPPARPTAPLVYLAIAVLAVAGADALDHVGAGIAARTPTVFAPPPGATCDYPPYTYHETTGLLL
ncbi:hypothetical protein GCM10010441_12000 [Kitasatospora paracochleata]|uniref:Uncharacterized protein n=1 Tax=Kitasatospora paracochleata TaxID=58354 RepID=A0ABT1JB30_9ACTN|nr:hypothetical protein [Kitasatospora paracochleata]MCP2313871.1 hypothetical protein [Kitasatospora paracochleata]